MKKRHFVIAIIGISVVIIYTNMESIVSFLIPEIERNFRYRQIMALKKSKEINPECDSKKFRESRYGEISGVESVGFSYCLIYKSASTQWLRVIKFLNGQSKTLIHPFEISKLETHHTKLQYIPYYRQEDPFVNTSLRLLTVRDPYTRLWSAYIDKFLLQDFWFTKGKYVIKTYRPNATQSALNCGNDVTFQEFIQYIVDLNGKALTFNQDKHWLPVTRMCHPCVFKPHYILKQETFAQDMTYMLRHLNIDWINNKVKADMDLTEFEMNDQLNYVLRLPPSQQCASQIEVLKRVWQAFKYNAYIPDTAKFPKNVFKRIKTEPEILAIFTALRHSWKKSETERKLQKRKWMVSAYRSLPRDLLEKMQSQYTDDFKIFNYNERPSDIFSSYM